jgi:tetratricopeptide (TPR) repeat protein
MLATLGHHTGGRSPIKFFEPFNQPTRYNRKMKNEGFENRRVEVSDLELCAFGNSLARQGKFAEAIAAYREAIRIDPNLAIFHCALGDALVGQNDLDEAIVAYRQALRLNPNLPVTHANLGNALATQGKLDEAISEYRQAIRIKPDLAEAHLDLGLCTD